MSKPVHMLSRTRKPLVVAGAVLAVMAFGATSAQATVAQHKGAKAEVYRDRVEQICDTESDGNGAYVTVKRGDGVEQSFWDGTGHDNECGGPFPVSQGIVQFKVCEHHEGCTEWINP
ncbi:MAG: hypothetical protein ACRDRU_10305 [Pseudonocardiaceae bacterium]